MATNGNARGGLLVQKVSGTLTGQVEPGRRYGYPRVLRNHSQHWDMALHARAIRIAQNEQNRSPRLRGHSCRLEQDEAYSDGRRLRQQQQQQQQEGKHKNKSHGNAALCALFGEYMALGRPKQRRARG